MGVRRLGLSEEAERTAFIAETLYREQQLGVNEIAQRRYISKVISYKYLRHRNVVIHAHRNPTVGKAPDNFWTKLLTKAKAGTPTSAYTHTT